MKHKAIIFLLLFIAANGFAQNNLGDLLQKHNTQSIQYISVEELRMFQLNGTVTILDAREPEEFKVSHLKSALNVGFNDFSSEEKQLENIKKDTQVIIYCSVGIRSEKIGEKLEKAGFTNVKNLYGGIFEWKNKGYPIIDSNGKETENVHAFSKHWSKYLQAGNPVY